MTKERARDLYLQKNYGISLAEYNKILKLQGNVCAICKKIPKSKSLAVDHCHKTGLVRGLVCWLCNRAIGVFKDNVARLIAAADYLTNVPATQALGKPRYTAPGVVGTKKRNKLLKGLNGKISK